MMKSLADEDLEPLIAMVRDDRGIDLGKYKEKYLRRRISVRLRASRAHSLSHYLKLLRQDEGEYQAFLATVTINTSSFFRNRGCFDVLAGTVLPTVALMAGLQRRQPPFVWSVGAARGEEAYSLAILSSAFPVFAGATRPPILATDIDEPALAEARRGSYGSRALEGLPPAAVERFFKPDGRRFVLADPIRNLVTFARHDALHDELPGRFLLVLCRNLLIYLEREAQEKLMSRLAEALPPGGYLMLGKSEILIGEARERFVPVFPEERIYQKIPVDLPAQSSNGPRRR